MGPPKNAARTISQEAFDEVVKENMEDLGMDPTEALEDAIQTLTLQGVDLSGTLLSCTPKSPNTIHFVEKVRENREIAAISIPAFSRKPNRTHLMNAAFVSFCYVNFSSFVWQGS